MKKYHIKAFLTVKIPGEIYCPEMTIEAPSKEMAVYFYWLITSQAYHKVAYLNFLQEPDVDKFFGLEVKEIK